MKCCHCIAASVICIAILAPLLCGNMSAAAPAADKPRAGLADLPRRYGAAKTFEDKQQVVRRAIQIGELGVKRLLTVVRRDFEASYKSFRTIFLKQVSSIKDPELDKILAADKRLAAMQQRLHHRAELLDMLTSASMSDGESKSALPLVKAFQKATVQWFRSKALMTQLDREEVRVIEETNKRRIAKGLPPLAVDYELCLAAADHSNDMATRGFFSHTSPVPEKRTSADRARRFKTTAHGENIARSRNGTHAMKMWMKSKGHRENILRPSLRRIGVGRVGGFFTQMFGR